MRARRNLVPQSINPMTNAQKLLAQARNAKTRRHLRLIRGKFEKVICHLSIELQESALRAFNRVAAKPSSY
jgi:hypothetical protein